MHEGQDGPEATRGPAPGTPEYDWLYGADPGASASDETRPLPHAGSGRPDATRVMPTVARPAAGPAPTAPRPARTPARPAPPPVAPPPGSAPSGPPRRPRFRLRWLGFVVLAWVVFVAAVPFWAWSKVDKVDAFPAQGRPGEQDGTTYLIVGSDSRAGLTEAERQDLGTGNAAGQRTDTIMLLHVGSGPNLLLSIPRDSIVDVPGHGTTKINAAFAYGGPRLLVQTVEEATGIRVDHYVEIGFGGFVDVVDAVGGIEICPTQDMRDPLAHLDIKKGCQQADGATALGYARSRHTTADSDFTRVVHQREVVSAVGRKAVSPWSVLNPVRYWRLNFAAAESLRVSEGTGPVAMGRFAWAMTHTDGKDGLNCTVPVADGAIHWDTDRADQLFAKIADDDTAHVGRSLCTPKGLPR